MRMSQRGPYAKGVRKRQEILQAALEVVAEHGFHQAFNREIAERVGLSQAGLMHYFGSREDLYMEVLRARDTHDSAAYWEPTGDFEGILQVISHNTEVPGLVQLYVEFSAEASIGRHPAHDYFVERNAWVIGVFSTAIRQAQESGEFGPHIDIEAAARTLVAAADGFQQQWLLDRDVDMAGLLKELWLALATRSHQPPDAPRAAPGTAPAE